MKDARPSNSNTIKKSRKDVSNAGEKLCSSIFPKTKLLPHTTTQKTSQE
ncbi:hypothetical protein JOD44_000771 [Salimicrobium jeotgali]|nr:hypothetical protein [Salimicrobium jeotgali]